MQSLRRPVAVATLMGVLAIPAFAGQRGNSGNHGPSTHPTHPNGPANAGPKTKGSSGPAAKGKGPESHGPVNSGTSVKHADGASKHKSGTTTTTSATGPTAINFNTTPVGSKLTKNVALQSKLATRLTALGYSGTVFEAAYGFKNLGQFVAATNVSRNLGIPFEQLKLQMTGLKVGATGQVLQANVNPDGSISLVDPANITHAAPTKSLGQSIQTLKPAANATTAASTASAEAENEIEHATTTTSKGGKKKS